MTSRAYVEREYRRFLRAVGYQRASVEALSALFDEMRRTAQARGMSEYEMATLYDADALLDLYREARSKSC